LRTGESGWQHFPRLLLPTSDTLGLMKTIFAGSSWRFQAGAGTILGALFLASSVPTMPRRRRAHAAERFFSSSLLPLLWSMKTRKAGLAFCLAAFACASASAQSFAAASIRPSAAEVQFEKDGNIQTSPGNLRMHDVTVAKCIKWAYTVQDSQISGPEWLQSGHFDIVAKADEPVGDEQMKLMMGTLLADRFKLAFHRDTKELRSYLMTVAKGGHKLHESAPDTPPFRENSALGTVVRGTTMKEFGDFMAGPLQAPVIDMTGLKGRYDFTLDFTSYLPPGEPVMKAEFDSSTGIIIAAMRGELGLDLGSKKESVEVLVIDHVERPSEN